MVGAVALLIALPGCGGSTTDTVTTTAAPATSAPAAAPESGSGPTTSTGSAEKYPEGSPQHTVLAWWSAVQANDPEAAIPLYVEPPTLPDLAGQFNYVEGQLAGTVKVTSAKKKGTVTTVGLLWTKPGGETAREAIETEEVGGESKILNTLFLDEIVKELQAKEAEGG